MTNQSVDHVQIVLTAHTKQALEFLLTKRLQHLSIWHVGEIEKVTTGDNGKPKYRQTIEVIVAVDEKPS